MSDLVIDLRERFACAIHHYETICELNADVSDARAVRVYDEAARLSTIFGQLDDTVDDIPITAIARTRELEEFVGPEQYERAMGAMIQATGVTFMPNDAADFVKMLDLSLSFLQAA
jgi:hypothetical protein